MSSPQLILVDGLPGSGKSTIAQLVCLQLRREGHPARWVYEHQQPHPIYDHDRLRAALEGRCEDDVHQRALAGWEHVSAQVVALEETWIVESALFQTGVGAQLAMGIEREAIRRHVVEVERRLAALAPLLIYFDPGDARAALGAARDRRGEWFAEYVVGRLRPTVWGQARKVAEFADTLSFFAEVKELTDDLMSGLAIETLRFAEQPPDWDGRRRAIAARLGLTRIGEPSLAPRSDDYIGRYLAEGTGDEMVFETHDGALRLVDGTCAYWIGGDRFQLQGLCIDVCFERGPDGSVAALTCEGQLPVVRRWVRLG